MERLCTGCPHLLDSHVAIASNGANGGLVFCPIGCQCAADWAVGDTAFPRPANYVIRQLRNWVQSPSFAGGEDVDVTALTLPHPE